jgi:hypothetical protein
MDFFRTRPVRNLIENNLDHFNVGVVNPGDTPLVESNMRCRFRWHFLKGYLSPSDNYRRKRAGMYSGLEHS